MVKDACGNSKACFLPRSRSTRPVRGAFRTRLDERLLSVVSTRRPPGLSTRASSSTPRWGPSRCSITCVQRTRLNASSGKGRASKVLLLQVGLEPLGRESSPGRRQNPHGDVEPREALGAAPHGDEMAAVAAAGVEEALAGQRRVESSHTPSNLRHRRSRDEDGSG
jgi:hypothetical protein